MSKKASKTAEEIMKENVMARYEKIKPIRWQDHRRYFCKEMTMEEVFEKDFRHFHHTFFDTPKEVGKELAILADVKMLHKFDKGGRLTATVADVLAQIPAMYLEECIAFELVYDNYRMHKRGIFAAEYDAGYYVSVVRLYKAADSEETAAPVSGTYPEPFAPAPVGITEDDLQTIKEVTEYMSTRGLY